MIVPVDETTIETAAALHAVSWQASHAAFCDPDFVALHTPAHQLSYLRQGVAAGKRLFMLVEGRPLGIVAVQGDLIEDLYVLPEAQERGYGTRLLRFAMAECDGVPRLWILENNHRAAALYQRHGFRFTGARHPLSDAIAEVELRRDGAEAAENGQII